MRKLISIGIWPSALWALLACGSAKDLNEGGGARDLGPGGVPGSDDQASGTLRAGQAPTLFPGGGTSGAARPLSPGLAPDTSDDCDPVASAEVSSGTVQSVCFYGPDDALAPAALIQQVVEVVGSEDWVHIRLTLNPDFVDNTYGDAAIGWGESDAEPRAPRDPAPADAPPAPNDADAAPPAPNDAAPPAPDDATPPEPPAPDDATPPAPRPTSRDSRAPRERPEAPGGAGRPRPGGGSGHSFRDLLGSDHAELQLLDTAGEVVVQLRLDYLSESDAAPSGYASLGISGGEGKLIIGQPEWILASTTSLDRNLNACTLASFTESSPVTDVDYTPADGASDWDYRVAYEVWISAEAFGSAGFGSALIENVHASPSKAAGDTVTVSPAPCPSDPSDPEAVPEPVPPVLTIIR